MKKFKSSESAARDLTARHGSDDFLIVGISASAGGIQALKEFFGSVPADSGAAYVVILHLSPDYESHLAEVLQVVTPIAVMQVTEKTNLQPNRIYAVSPNRSLSMVDGHIAVAPIQTVEERHAPVDIFFRTLAESHGERAVCVVLSGTGADRSMGMKRVKERGGVVFVQNPSEAEFSEMPRHSIATDLVDAVLPVAEIPKRIIAYKDSIGKVEIPVEPESRPEELQQALREIFTQLRVCTGHDFSNYKRPTVLRRIERCINVRALPDLQAYAAFLRETPEETQALLKDLLISVTNFFRDKEAFEILERDIVPSIIGGKTAADEIRVWTAGCATGEEAYNVAMLLAEKTFDIADAPKVQIFATDIDDAAIVAAREGFYTLNDAADVSPERLRRFFSKQGDGYRIRRELREMVLFANHNIIKDPPFSRLDLATCRNMLIYLNQAAQERVLETLHFALNPGGYLFLGMSESIDGASDLYAPVSKEHLVFQSRRVAPRRALLVPEAASRPEKTMPLPPLNEQRENRSAERISYSDLHWQLLEQYAPPSVLINEKYDIVHLSERARRYLQVAGGEPSHNLLNLIRPDLRPELRAALFQATRQQTNVKAHGLKVKIDDRAGTINLRVCLVLHPDDTARGFILVIFEPDGTATAQQQEQPTENTQPTEAILDPAPEPLVRRLEEELIFSKAQLRTGIEQYEMQTEELRASNEELQAMNKELRSTAEELETSREELQSVNEELITVNQELKIKIEELSTSNSNFQNLINSTDIGTIFLDHDFRVNLFTPAAREIFNLIPADVGRPLSDITGRLETEQLHADANAVLSKLQTVEREVRTTDGRAFLMQMFPYRTLENRISGVVVTFVNITRRKKAEEALQETAERLERQSRLFDTTLSSLSDFAYTFDKDGRFVFSNRPLLDLLGITLDEIKGKNFFDLNYPTALAARLQSEIQQVFDTKKAIMGETPFTAPDGAEGYYEYIFNPVIAADGTVESVAGSTRDITTRRRMEIELREREQFISAVTDASPTLTYIFDLQTGANLYTNRQIEKLFGYTPDEIRRIGADFTERMIHPDDHATVERHFAECVAASDGEIQEFEYRFRLRSGDWRWIHSYDTVFRRDEKNGKATQIIGVAMDMTENKRAAIALRESEERFRAMFEQANVGIVQLSVDGRLLAPNPGFCKLIGYTEEEARRLTARDITYPDDYEREAELTEQLVAGDIPGYSIEKRYVCKNGDAVWGTMTTTLVRGEDNEPLGILSIVEDISERKAAEEAVRESEERLRLLVESASDYAIFTVTPANIIDSWNAGAEAVFGYAESEIIGRSGAILFTREDREREVPREEIMTALREGRAEDERWHIRKDGTRFFASGVMRPLLDGKVEGFVKICRDQTDQLQAEKAVRDKEILQKLVAAQEDERRRIARDLHDHLGQQMTALRLKLANARQLCNDSPLSAEIDEIQRSAERIDADVDFLAWELRPAALDDLGLAAALDNYIKEWTRHTGIEAEFYASNLKHVRLTPEAETNLYRITQEALNNTYKHAAATGASVMLEQRGSLIVLIIEDDGIGFDAEDRQTQGKGIGLLGMRERAALIGGKIQIESTPQNGTTIFVRIPIEPVNN